MNALINFYELLAPVIPFEFIKHRSADECAAMLAAQAGARIGLLGGKLNVEITPDSNRGYVFSVKRNIYTYFIAEIGGTITVMADDYSQVEGSARAKPGPFGILVFLLVVIAHWIIGLVFFFSGLASPDKLVVIPVDIVFVILLFVFYLFILRAQRWVLSTYADMILGTLLRII